MLKIFKEESRKLNQLLWFLKLAQKMELQFQVKCQNLNSSKDFKLLAGYILVLKIKIISV